jgi:hypothetical protein
LHIQYEVIDKKNILSSASQDFYAHAQVSLTPNIEDENMASQNGLFVN